MGQEGRIPAGPYAAAKVRSGSMLDWTGAHLGAKGAKGKRKQAGGGRAWTAQSRCENCDFRRSALGKWRVFAPTVWTSAGWPANRLRAHRQVYAPWGLV